MDFSQPAPWHFFFYRFVMVVRKNVLEYIIALVVVKNKVRLKKCLNKKISNMTKFYCPNKSIYYFFKINTKISTTFRRSMLISFWINVPGADPGGRAHPVRAPTLKLEKNMIVWRKIVIFHTKYPKYFRTSQFF